MTRRTLLSTLAAAPALLAATARTAMGVGIHSFGGVRPANEDTIQFLEYCHGLGAGGVQTSLSSLEPDYARRLRARAEALGMYFEASGSLPRNGETERFEKTLMAAKEAGASCIRCVCLSGRRYETFATLDEWERFVASSRAAVKAAIPIARRHKVALALENHKDWTGEEFLRMLHEFRDDYFGVCLDMGNNLALLDDPYAFVDALAPHAVSTHVKDMGLQETESGFLLSEVPLGRGMLDMARLMKSVRDARPATRFTLEMITRDPLVVPCLTEKYWTTFPTRNGSVLARAIQQVRAKGSKTPLPRTTGLDKPARDRLAEDNVKECLRHSREVLGV